MNHTISGKVNSGSINEIHTYTWVLLQISFSFLRIKLTAAVQSTKPPQTELYGMCKRGNIQQYSLLFSAFFLTADHHSCASTAETLSSNLSRWCTACSGRCTACTLKETSSSSGMTCCTCWSVLFLMHSSFSLQLINSIPLYCLSLCFAEILIFSTLAASYFNLGM